MQFSHTDKVEIAVLKNVVASHVDDIAEIRETIQKINVTVDRIDKLMSRNMGFFGGVAFAFSLIGASIALALSTIFKEKVGL